MLAYKTEGLEEEAEVGGDVRGSPWLNLVIRASGGVGMVCGGDTGGLGFLFFHTLCWLSSADFLT